jgi:hypothetical protein
MTGKFSTKPLRILGGAALLVTLTACSLAGPAETATPQIVEVTRIVEQTTVVTQIVEIETVITATAQPEALPASASQTGQPGVTPALAANDNLAGNNGFAGWCTPKNMPASQEGLPQAGAMPEGANPVQTVDGKKEVVIEVQNCSFVYTLDRPILPGTQFKMYDNSGSPFLTVELTPTTQFPNKGFVTVTHPYVINPPFWTIPYRLDLVSPDGKVLQSDEVNFKRGWTPRVCYDGSWPNPVTLKCKFMGEAHPWDPWHGKENPYEPTLEIDD